MDTSTQPGTREAQIRAVFARMELTPRELARRAKLGLASVRQAIAFEYAPAYRTWMAIEDVLGQPLWSSAASFRQWQEVKTLLGFLPQVESLTRLRQRAAELGIKGYQSPRSKPALTALILHDLAARGQGAEILSLPVAEAF